MSGVSLHFDAIEVIVDAYGVQRAHGEADRVLELVHEAVGADGHWDTFDLDGRDYVLIATPFC